MLRVANVVQLKARRLMPALVLQALAAGCIVFAIYIAVWSIWVAPDYYPRGDNFSVLVNSLPEFHPKISDWFFQGFRTYFHVYPDMSKNGTNFIRPGVNVTFFMEWFIFHRHWERYLLFTYATVAALAGMVYYTARSFFFVSPRLALLAALAVGFA